MEPEDLLAAWNEFVSTKKILPGVPPLVANSWLRCQGRINPLELVKFKMLSADHLLATQVASFDLISVARPVLEDIHQSLAETDVGVVLLNGAGYIVDILAGPRLRALLDGAGFRPGVICTEEHIGTNALGLALTERMPVEIVGPEHYCRQFHPMAAAAAPVFDISGRAMGVLALVSPVDSYDSYSLGLAITGAKAIEAQGQADHLLAEYNGQLTQLNAVLDTISDGIVVWSSEKVLMHINRGAAKMIGLPVKTLIGAKFGSRVTYPDFVVNALNNMEPLTDVEANLSVGDKSLNCLLSLRFVHNRGELQWIISTIRPIKEVRQLVQRQVGAHALFSLDDIVGESQPIRSVRRQVKAAAAATASIFIGGESGTGKNILASAIHNASPRRDGPFLIFPCSSIPSELVLSELVGREGGSLSRGPGSRPSKFELAQGGTIYFQDVDTLPLEAQSILLNVVEMKVVQRLGGDRPMEVDVRVIASTSADMRKLITERRFRADLYYRLSTFTIQLPSLRERSGDIPIFVERILKRLSRQLDQPLALGEGVMDVLCRYSWPGNIRELEALLGPAATLVGPAGVIELEHLPETVRRPSVFFDENEELVQIKSLDEVEREAIQRTARLWRGNLGGMADALGIGRTTLWRKIKKYGVVLEEYQG